MNGPSLDAPLDRPRRCTALPGAAILTAGFVFVVATRAEAQQRPTPLEAGIVEELNRVRTDPAGYAAHLEALLPAFDGKVLRTPHGLLETSEGAAAVRETIRVLRATTPMARLSRSPGLAAGARDLARDQRTSGATGHVGKDGSSPSDRVTRYGQWDGQLTENVAYGAFEGVTAREVVIQLLVDDGVPDRGHRVNVLDPLVRLVGVACGPHRRYAVVCVMDHAQRYEERPS